MKRINIKAVTFCILIINSCLISSLSIDLDKGNASVPNLLRRTESEAKAELESSGLKLGKVELVPTNDKQLENLVMDQYKHIRSIVPKGSSVDILIGKYVSDKEKIIPPFIRQSLTPRFIVVDEGPRLIRKVSPEYPISARQRGIQGRVDLNLEIFVNGTVGEVEVTKSLMMGPGGLDEAAVKAVKQWEFLPAKVSGKPIGVWYRIPVYFKLD